MTTTEEIEKVIARLEREGILLSQYGNHAARGSILGKEAYYKSKKENALFGSLEAIDRIRRNIESDFVVATEWTTETSYGLKHHVEEWRETNDHDEVRGDYLTNGDFILAMILKRYEYKFRDRVNAKVNSPSHVNCVFKCRTCSP